MPKIFIKVKINWKEKIGIPKVGEKVIVALQHWNTKGIRFAHLKKVNEGDNEWRFVDDNSEPSYDWNAIYWLKEVKISPVLYKKIAK